MLNEFIEKVIVHEGEEREKRKAAELPQSEHQKPKKQGRIVEMCITGYGIPQLFLSFLKKPIFCREIQHC